MISDSLLQGLSVCLESDPRPSGTANLVSFVGGWDVLRTVPWWTYFSWDIFSETCSALRSVLILVLAIPSTGLYLQMCLQAGPVLGDLGTGWLRQKQPFAVALERQPLLWVCPLGFARGLGAKPDSHPIPSCCAALRALV